MYVPLNDLGYGNKRRQSKPMSRTTAEGKVGLARKLAPIIFCGDPTVMLLCGVSSSCFPRTGLKRETISVLFVGCKNHSRSTVVTTTDGGKTNGSLNSNMSN